MMVDLAIIELIILLMIIILIISFLGIRIIPYHQIGLWIDSDKIKKELKPGIHWIYPFKSEIMKIDMRTRILDLPGYEVISKDNIKLMIHFIIHCIVKNPKKVYFENVNHPTETIKNARRILSRIISIDEEPNIMKNRIAISNQLKDMLNKKTKTCGVEILYTEILNCERIKYSSKNNYK